MKNILEEGDEIDMIHTNSSHFNFQLFSKYPSLSALLFFKEILNTMVMRTPSIVMAELCFSSLCCIKVVGAWYIVNKWLASTIACVDALYILMALHLSVTALMLIKGNTIIHYYCITCMVQVELLLCNKTKASNGCYCSIDDSSFMQELCHKICNHWLWVNFL